MNNIYVMIPLSLFDLMKEKQESSHSHILTVTFTCIKKWLLSTILFLKKSRGEGWDLFSNQQMGLEFQKNLGLLILSEVEGGS